jgi:siroheme synthase
MGVATLPAVATALQSAGRAPSTPVVSIENGGSPRQRVIRSTLANAAETIAAEELRNPAVTVIGPAAAALTPTIR